jgi:hypothetical protein
MVVQGVEGSVPLFSQIHYHKYTTNTHAHTHAHNKEEERFCGTKLPLSKRQPHDAIVIAHGDFHEFWHVDAKCRHLVEQNPCAFWIWALKGRVIGSNELLEKMFNDRFPDPRVSYTQHATALLALVCLSSCWSNMRNQRLDRQKSSQYGSTKRSVVWSPFG